MKKHYNITCRFDINKKQTTKNKDKVTCKRCLAFIKKIPNVLISDIYNPKIFAVLEKNNQLKMQKFIKQGIK